MLIRILILTKARSKRFRPLMFMNRQPLAASAPRNRMNYQNEDMNAKPERVTIVLDPEFGERLSDLARDAHVWVVDSAQNKVAVEHYMEELKSRSINAEEQKLTLTIFHRRKLDSGFLETLEDHHGEYAQNPPWSEIEVIGSLLDKQTQELLKDWGFRDFEPTSEGFIARKQVTPESGKRVPGPI
jgi:hypothetical protein